ncbi:ATP-binding protein [Candidatus Palauibacter sp.]|uniref:ATP-binding protein n=1 Tax=Candidatus Palauibacter sp. TaxID=3101350 RepID=UPI003B51EC49
MRPIRAPAGFADRLEVMNSGRLQPPLTVEKLRVAYPSLPGNPLLAESMYLLRYIERMGTGTVDMIRRCVDAGLAEPEFDANGGFVTRIERGGAGPDGAPLSGSTQETTQERILALLREDPGLTRRALATRIGITADGVKYHLDKLRNAGRIRHVGATKKGHWEILNDG